MKKVYSLIPLFVFMLQVCLSQAPDKYMAQLFKMKKNNAQKLPAGIDKDWYQAALANIQKSEYTIRSLGGLHTFGAANKKNNAVFYLDSKGYQIKNLLDQNCKAYNFIINGVGRKNIQWTASDFLYTSQENNYLVYHYNNFNVEYSNDAKGMRQNFVILNKPGKKGSLSVQISLDKTLSSKLNSSTQLELNYKDNDQKVKILYDDLKVWDANNKVLAAHMELQNNHTLALVVDDKNATYPVTIDPLNKTPEWTTSANGVLFYLPTQVRIDAAYGFNVAGVGDVNGDGFDDIAVGAPGTIDTTGPSIIAAGAVFVYFGRAAGPSTTPDKILRATTTNTGALFGFSIAGGNVIGDSRNDIIVGAPGDGVIVSVVGVPSTVRIGKVYVFSGENLTATVPTAFTFDLTGTPTSFAIAPLFGYSVGVTEDLNGSGRGEIIVGAPGYAGVSVLPNLPVRSGAAFVFYSVPAGARPDSINPRPVSLFPPSTAVAGTPLLNTDGLLFGFSVDGLGDYNKDGKFDVVVGAPAGVALPTGNFLNGSAYLFYGTPTGIDSTAGTQLIGGPSLTDTVPNLFGYFVRGVRTASAVRNGNVLVGAPSGKVLSNVQNGLRLKTGTVNVFFGKLTPGPSQIPNQSFSSPRDSSLLILLQARNLNATVLFGASIDNMLDVNCDGINDIIVGEPLSTGVGVVNANVVGGAAYIFLGKADGTYATPPFWTLKDTVSQDEGINAGSLLGYSVSGAKFVRGRTQGVRALVGAPGRALDFSSGILKTGTTLDTLFNFLDVNNGIGKAFLFGFAACSTLPITLLDFKGVLNNKQVILTWNTSVEINTNYFDVQRSFDGTSFEKIGTLASKGNSSTGNTYQLTDISPIQGNNYYRLKTVDKDGKFVYSSAVLIKIGNRIGSGISLNSNPSHGDLRLNFYGIEKGLYKIVLTNSAGKVQLTDQVSISQTSEQKTINLRSHMARGIYMLNVYNGTNRRISSIKVFID